MQKSRTYGPVTSRRLGLSLGIDTVPYKICSFDCIYCQIGRTSKTTAERSDFGLAETIFAELGRKIEQGLEADHITLGGSGEPTLNLEAGDIIRGIKKMTNIPVAVLTNGSMLWDEGVRNDLYAADLVLPSLDAADEETFLKINRPHPDISFKRLLDGILSFSKVFTGKIWLEIFFIEDFNTSDAQLEEFKKLVKMIHPDRVHLNTAVRPPAESFAAAVDREALQAIAKKIGGRAEVIAEFTEKHRVPPARDLLEQDLVDMLLRRPCTIQDIATVLNINPSQAIKLLDPLIARGRVAVQTAGPQTYYSCTEETDYSR